MDVKKLCQYLDIDPALIHEGEEVILETLYLIKTKNNPSRLSSIKLEATAFLNCPNLP